MAFSDESKGKIFCENFWMKSYANDPLDYFVALSVVATR